MLQVFSALRKECPDALKRLVPIEGDISLPGLGMSEENWKTITNSVSVIFHLAATIRFDEPIRKALQFNVLGVREVVRLARQSNKLQVSCSCVVHAALAISYTINTCFF